MSGIIKHLENILYLFELNERRNERQIAWYRQELKNAKPIKVERVADILDERTVRKIKRLKSKKKMCYKNAHRLCAMFDNIEYCEGMVECMGMVIDHAFNKVIAPDGSEHYIDVTFEFALKDRNVTEYEYVVLGEYNYTTITEITSRTGYYGQIYKHLFYDSMIKPVNI